MTSFSVCRVWGLFFAVLPLVMATGYAQEAGDVEKVDVLVPYASHVQPDEMIVVEGAIVNGETKMGYYALGAFEHLFTGEVDDMNHGIEALRKWLFDKGVSWPWPKILGLPPLPPISIRQTVEPYGEQTGNWSVVPKDWHVLRGDLAPQKTAPRSRPGNPNSNL
jgi:hypothetical protein